MIGQETSKDANALVRIVSDPDAVHTKILQHYPRKNTQKALIVSIKALIKHNPELGIKFPKQVARWHELFKSVHASIAERMGTAEPTEKELQNWVSWEDAVRKQRELSGTEYGSTDHLLLSMYTLIEPIRADYGSVRVFYEGDPRIPGMASGEKSDAKTNFIVIGALTTPPGQSKLVLGSYKTSGKYGLFSRILPDPLVHIIQTNMRRRPDAEGRRFLFVDGNNTPFSCKNSFSKFANRKFEKIFGKKVTISLLRHSFISNINFNESTPNQLLEHARNMHHSLSMQQLYRRTVPLTVGARKTPSPRPVNSEGAPGRIVVIR